MGVTHGEYASAMKEIVMYNSLTERQMNAMSATQLNKWEEKAYKAEVIKRKYIKQQDNKKKYV